MVSKVVLARFRPGTGCGAELPARADTAPLECGALTVTSRALPVSG